MTSPRDHWGDHARRWQHVRPPLRPSEQDVAIFSDLIAKHCPKVPLRVLLLGVTPELVTLTLPAGSKLTAVEKNEAMIAHVFPQIPGRSALCADWRMLPFEDASFHLVLGDGCLTTLETKSDYRLVCSQLRRVLRPDGVLLHRFFIRPDQAENPGAVFSDLRNGSIALWEIFKWRIAMSLVDSDSGTVVLDDIYRTVTAHLGAELTELVDLGFPRESIATLNHYRGTPKRYSFPKRAELPHWLSPSFALAETQIPTYDFGERCPITSWRPTR